MRVEILDLGDWRKVLRTARSTRGLKPSGKNPSPDWIRRILLAEHSPIRSFHVEWRWIDLPYWVSVHFVRHKTGIEHFVQSQREDITGNPRNIKPQGAPVIHHCVANAQAILYISRKRLCNKASPETRQAWSMFLTNLARAGETTLPSCCVRECVYRGWCPEMEPCGFADTDEYVSELVSYRVQNDE